MIVKKSASFDLLQFCENGTSDFSDTKPGILELRKEKSRDAARSRRGKENYEFYELAKLLPLPAAITSQLDKASIIRLTISFLKLRDFSYNGDPPWRQDGFHGVSNINKNSSPGLSIMEPFESRQGTHTLQALDGFPFILSNDGKLLYISETVSIYLGLSQVEMTGSSLFDYVHHLDHTELIQQLGMCSVPIGPNGSPQSSGSDDGSSSATQRSGSPSEKGYMMTSNADNTIHKSFSLRMKSTLTKRGIHVKTSGYRVINIVGTVRSQPSLRSRGTACSNSNIVEGSHSSETTPFGFVGMGIALPSPTIPELRLEMGTFITRMSPDFKVTYCEPVIADVMDLSVDDIRDRLLYDVCHVEDLQNLRKSHIDILNKGQALTDYYRIMNRSGGYVWIQTCATAMLNTKNAEIQNILAINFVVSGLEDKHITTDLWQVTGDVSSVMSNVTINSAREDKLNELQSNKDLSTSTSTNVASNSWSSNGTCGSSPKVFPSDNTFILESTILEISSLKTPSDQTEDFTKLSSQEKNNGNLDSRIKCRKMDNPRKRKRSMSDSQEEIDTPHKTLNLSQNVVTNSIISATSPHMASHLSQNVTKVLNDNSSVSTKAWDLTTDNITSSLPEDLSIKRKLNKYPNLNINQQSAPTFFCTTSPDSTKEKADSYLTTNNKTPLSPLLITRSTVKDLEVAMNQHLPTTIFNNETTTTTNIANMDPSRLQRGITDQSNSRLPSNQQPPSTSLQKSSTFKHSLSNNRESVIKINFRPHAPPLHHEPPSNFPTPPEVDPIIYRNHNSQYSYETQDSVKKNNIATNSRLETMETFNGDHYRYFPYKDQIYYKDHFSYKDHIVCKDHIAGKEYIPHWDHISYKEHIQSSHLEHIPAHRRPYKEFPHFKEIPSFTIPSLLSPTTRSHHTYQHLQHQVFLPDTSAATDVCILTSPTPTTPDISKHTDQFDTNNFSRKLNSHDHIHKNSTIINTSSQAPKSLEMSTTHHYHFSTYERENVHQSTKNGDTLKATYFGVPAPIASAMYMDLTQQRSGSPQYDAYTKSAMRWY